MDEAEGSFRVLLRAHAAADASWEPQWEELCEVQTTVSKLYAEISTTARRLLNALLKLHAAGVAHGLMHMEGSITLRADAPGLQEARRAPSPPSKLLTFSVAAVSCALLHCLSLVLARVARP